jgi:hypothetical protein
MDKEAAQRLTDEFEKPTSKGTETRAEKARRLAKEQKEAELLEKRFEGTGDMEGPPADEPKDGPSTEGEKVPPKDGGTVPGPTEGSPSGSKAHKTASEEDLGAFRRHGSQDSAESQLFGTPEEDRVDGTPAGSHRDGEDSGALESDENDESHGHDGPAPSGNSTDGKSAGREATGNPPSGNESDSDDSIRLLHNDGEEKSQRQKWEEELERKQQILGDQLDAARRRQERLNKQEFQIRAEARKVAETQKEVRESVRRMDEQERRMEDERIVIEDERRKERQAARKRQEELQKEREEWDKFRDGEVEKGMKETAERHRIRTENLELRRMLQEMKDRVDAMEKQIRDMQNPHVPNTVSLRSFFHSFFHFSVPKFVPLLSFLL